MSRETTILPTHDTALLDAAATMLRSDDEVSLAAADETVALPAELRALLTDVVTAMRRGQAVTVAPLGQQLTTQQAADLLGVSRPTLIKLLEHGRIPYETPGRHRRLRLGDVLAFQQMRHDEQRDALRELAAQSQELGLYDANPDAFGAALREGRRRLA